MGCLKGLAVVLLTLIVFLVLVAGYFGFVPVLSKLMGSSKPRDLGVAFNAEAGLKGAKIANLPLTYDDLDQIAKNPDSAKSFNSELSDVEASSLMLLRLAQLDNSPVYLTTVKFNPDNSAEASGIIRVRNIGAFLQNTGVSKEDADTVVSTLKLVQDAPFYVKGKAEISDNRVSLDVSQLEIGRLPLPTSLFESNKGTVENYVGKALSVNGVQVKSLSVRDGKVKAAGTRPLSSLEPWLKMVQ